MKLIRRSSQFNFDPNNIVSNPDVYKKKAETYLDISGMPVEKKVFSDDGLYSPRIFGELDIDSEYSCQCGKFKGKFYEGTVCDKCGTKVVETGANIDKMGWIDLEDIYIIKYIAYSMLEKVIGKENLKNITQIPNVITLEGDLDYEKIEEERNSAPNKKYWYIGIQKFKENYTEVLDYYYELSNKQDKKMYEFLQNIDDIFTNKIPVISSVLRPIIPTADGMKFDEINVHYINILTDVKILKNKVDQIDLVRSLTIECIQAEYFKLSEKVLNNIKTKAGFIRNQICGTRINFSARHVISPAKIGVGMDEIVLPYQTFLELYKYEIINILVNMRKINYPEAEHIIYEGLTEFNQDLYNIMKKIIKTEEVGVLLNRNPTISFGSILYLKVCDIKENITDNTMSIHNLILSLLSGDYDGDVLNLISLKDKTVREVCKATFSPVSLLVNANNGKFNKALNLERDQVLGINNLLI